MDVLIKASSCCWLPFREPLATSEGRLFPAQLAWNAPERCSWLRAPVQGLKPLGLIR